MPLGEWATSWFGAVGVICVSCRYVKVLPGRVLLVPFSRFQSFGVASFSFGTGVVVASPRHHILVASLRCPSHKYAFVLLFCFVFLLKLCVVVCLCCFSVGKMDDSCLSCNLSVGRLLRVLHVLH